jgi:hypothetical protein
MISFLIAIFLQWEVRIRIFYTGEKRRDSEVGKTVE